MASTLITTNADALKRAARKLSTHSGPLNPNQILNALSAAIAGPGKNWGFLQGAPGGRYIQPGLTAPNAYAPSWILFVEGHDAYTCGSKDQALDVFAVLAGNSENKSEAEADLVSNGAATLTHPVYAPIRVFLSEQSAEPTQALHPRPPVRRGVPLTSEVIDRLQSLVAKRRNIIIGGVAGAGRTSLLQHLSQAIPQNDRIVCIEEHFELAISQSNTTRILVTQEAAWSQLRNAARMKPDFVILGDLNSSESYSELIELGATGHSILSAMNAESLSRGVRRIELHMQAVSSRRTNSTIRERISQASLVYVFLHHVVGQRAPRVEAATISLGADDGLVHTPIAL